MNDDESCAICFAHDELLYAHVNKRGRAVGICVDCAVKSARCSLCNGTGTAHERMLCTTCDGRGTPLKRIGVKLCLDLSDELAELQAAIRDIYQRTASGDHSGAQCALADAYEKIGGTP